MEWNYAGHCLYVYYIAFLPMESVAIYHGPFQLKNIIMYRELFVMTFHAHMINYVLQ